MDPDTALGSLYHVDMDCIPDVSKVYAASIFRLKVSRMSHYSCIHMFWFNRVTGAGEC
jgi:hypothetical protein